MVIYIDVYIYTRTYTYTCILCTVSPLTTPLMLGFSARERSPDRGPQCFLVNQGREPAEGLAGEPCNQFPWFPWLDNVGKPWENRDLYGKSTIFKFGKSTISIGHFQ